MAGPWLFVSGKWKLQDVQAVVNVVISLLSAVCIVALARVRWQRSASRIARQKPTSLNSLFSITSPGDALDLLGLLRSKILQSKYVPALLQCILVVILTVTAILSGPIARYSTRTGQKIAAVPINGSMAITGAPATLYNTITIRQTVDSLRQAGFPTDQMLDFLPETSIPWIYRANEWNSTWAAQCAFIPSTKIALNATGNYSLYLKDPNDPVALLNEIPALQNVWPSDFQDGNSPVGVGGQISLSYANYWPPSAAYQDELLFMLSFLYSNDSDSAWSAVYPIDHWMNISIAAVYMHGGPIPVTTADNLIGDFGKGLIPESYFTRVDCNMSRVRQDENFGYQSYPNTRWVGEVATAYPDHFAGGWVSQSVSNQKIVLPTGQDLFRLFQAYTVVKDSEYSGAKVARSISVKFQTVELSIIFLVVALLATLLVIFGILRYVSFIVRHREVARSTPQSKIDWMIQAVKEAEAVGILRNDSIEANMAGDSSLSPRLSRVATFDSAMYSNDASVSAKHQGRIMTGPRGSVQLIPSPDLELRGDHRYPFDQTGPGSKPLDNTDVRETFLFRNELGRPTPDAQESVPRSRNWLSGYELPTHQELQDVVIGSEDRVR